MLAAIDEETLLVPVSHVLFKSAFLQDARAITERAHEVGALVVLDTYQSAGTVPFSVKELDVDFATGGSVKWLCGGPGAGYLYVAPRLQQKLEPKVDRKSTRLNSSHDQISYAVFCLKKKKKNISHVKGLRQLHLDAHTRTLRIPSSS